MPRASNAELGIVSPQWHGSHSLCALLCSPTSPFSPLAGTGTPALGRRKHKKTHTICRRCGKVSYHKQNQECASCGYPNASMRRCEYPQRDPPGPCPQQGLLFMCTDCSSCCPLGTACLHECADCLWHPGTAALLLAPSVPSNRPDPPFPCWDDEPSNERSSSFPIRLTLRMQMSREGFSSQRPTAT